MCREVRHRWFRSAVVRPTLRLRETDPLRAMTCAVTACVCTFIRL